MGWQTAVIFLPAITFRTNGAQFVSEALAAINFAKILIRSRNALIR
jgi:hypothetical protein